VKAASAFSVRLREGSGLYKKLGFEEVGGPGSVVEIDRGGGRRGLGLIVQTRQRVHEGTDRSVQGPVTA
jgi:hypothetical protein